MFKRFHDADKYDKPWYRKLTCAEKCAWDFITSKCDNVGVWTPDFEGGEFFIGEELDWDMFRERCNGNIDVLPDGKWWLTDFCIFQYAVLSEDTNSNALRSYINLLKKHKLWERYLEGTCTLLDKDKDKDQDIDKDKDKEILTHGNFQNVKLSRKDFDILGAEYGENKRTEIIDKLSAYKKSKGKVYKSDIGAIRQWVLEAVKAVKLSEKPKPVEIPGRPDAQTQEEQEAHRREIAERTPLTEAEIEELEALKIKALSTGSGRLLAAVMRGNTS